MNNASDLDFLLNEAINIKKNNFENKNIIEYKCDCNLPEIYEEQSGEKVCIVCGIIIDKSTISSSAEWRNFKSDDGTSNFSGERCGMPHDDLLPNSSMGGKIQGSGRLQTLNKWLNYDYDENVIINIKKKLEEIVVIHDIPQSVIRGVLIMFKKILTTKNNNNKREIHRGKVKDGLLAICLYYSCKKINYNIQSSKIIEIYNIDNKIFNSCCKIYIENIDDSLDTSNNTAYSLMQRFCNELSIPFKFQKISKNILISCENLKILTDITPQSLCSGILWFLNLETNSKLNKNIISKVCDVSETTMVKVYKILIINKGNIFNFIKNQKNN